MNLITNPKHWNRLIFRISPFSGRVSRKYNITSYFQKIDTNEIDFIFRLIEKKSNYFMFLRMKTCSRFFFSILGVIILIISILCFFCFNTKIGGIILLTVFIAETVLLNYLYLDVSYREYFKKTYKKTYLLLNDINKNIFSEMSMHMMLSPALDFIALYTVPKTFKMSFKINTLKPTETQESYINISTQPVIHKQVSTLANRDLSESQFNQSSETTPSEVLKSYLELKKTEKNFPWKNNYF